MLMYIHKEYKSQANSLNKLKSKFTNTKIQLIIEVLTSRVQIKDFFRNGEFGYLHTNWCKAERGS